MFQEMFREMNQGREMNNRNRSNKEIAYLNRDEIAINYVVDSQSLSILIIAVKKIHHSSTWFIVIVMRHVFSHIAYGHSRISAKESISSLSK